MTEKIIELVFIPFPVPSHLTALVKLANLLTDTDRRLSITFLVLKTPIDTKIDSHTNNSTHPRVRFLQIIPKDESKILELMKSPKPSMLRFLEIQKADVKDAVAKIMEDPTRIVAAFVLDMFCTTMMKVADEFRIPSYMCFTCSAAVLGLKLHFKRLSDEFGPEYASAQYEGRSDKELSVSTYINPYPATVLPSPVFEKEMMNHFKRFQDCKGIVINTFLELESHAVKSLLADEKVPNIYPIGPMILEANEEEKQRKGGAKIVEWLDQQPDSSVVFLCFGTNGCFEREQVKEIATALEKSGHRFLWSLRKPAPEAKFGIAGDYEDPEEVLPEGFLQRTLGQGKVIGWAPQMAVLSHSSVGGFVSHCWWNSSLESVWCGVPLAVWPLFAEQQANAFQFVKEFRMAVEIKMDYRRNCGVIVGAEKIETAIRELMDLDNEIRFKVKGMKDKSRVAIEKGGSSHDFLERLIQDFVEH